MPSRKNPIDQVKDVAIEAIKHPRGTAEKAVGTARETAAIGRMVAGQVGRTAVSRGVELAGDVLSRATGRHGSTKPAPSSAPVLDPDAPKAGTAAQAGIAAKTAKVPSARVPSEDSDGGPAPDAKAPVTKAPAKKAAKKTTAKKAPAKKAAAKKSADSDVPTPAEVAENIAPAKKAAAKKTAAKKAAKETTATTATPGDKLPPKKKPAEKTADQPADSTAETPADAEPNLPRAAVDVRDSDDVDVTTPVGTSAAGEATNPDTDEHDLQQPGTPPLMDPGTVHAVQSEAATMQKAADVDKGVDKGADKSPDEG